MHFSPSLVSRHSDLDLSNESLFTTYIDNHRTANHRSVIFGLRQLNSTEMIHSCSNSSAIIADPPLTNERFQFTANYELRLFTSGCFSLDENGLTWKSDGMTVGPLTNRQVTQCFFTPSSWTLCRDWLLCFCVFVQSLEIINKRFFFSQKIHQSSISYSYLHMRLERVLGRSALAPGSMRRNSCRQWSPGRRTRGRDETCSGSSSISRIEND